MGHSIIDFDRNGSGLLIGQGGSTEPIGC